MQGPQAFLPCALVRYVCVLFTGAVCTPPRQPFSPYANRERLAASDEEGSIATTTWQEVELAVKASPQVRSVRFGKTEVWEWRQMRVRSALVDAMARPGLRHIYSPASWLRQA